MAKKISDVVNAFERGALQSCVDREAVNVTALTRIDTTLQERGKTHGDFAEQSRVTQAIKNAMHNSPNWASLPDYMKEAMDMTAHKYGRILCGDWTHRDHSHDVVGYNRLVEQELEKAGK